MSCKSMRQLELELNGVVDNPTNDKISTLEKLLVNFPALEVLHLDSFFVEALFQMASCSAQLLVEISVRCRLRQNGLCFQRLRQSSFAVSGHTGLFGTASRQA
ncbi:hypothetical protein T459_29117 [Capsicum annuum]|uniref:Uncharacterized protein n=1 Tax=Capsicum annuum TaxID=4072 RepID=A0A2G2Y4M7_CAPAN|nr:hypothetical protein T459_29117 [Capsicum annuum]